ncbi:hypothetical protein CONLIGDRAFT_690178 [Coniochaeta ligniaria NRRL 30616]|uniref:Serine hydrolase domain-containing protein n=1 Tax=Coniochaeta ligniaria NRRL 30616 TaxID=1408157 RepID=A0A1J7J7Z8_9PEZI|nr:hypothetical protein CONLIGDRAFT_690178 [Coniochaeta ligniaria NRRL 30616]
MKILGIHPWGTSGPIFERQMAAITSMLGRNDEYVYINGPIECERARDLPDWVKGPFYCWYNGLSTPECKEAHKVVAATIADEGPFDGVIGFSQGASLALSFMMDHEISCPNQAVPFKFGIFFCSNAVISPDIKFNADMVPKYAKYYRTGESIPDVDSDDDENGDGNTKNMNGMPTQEKHSRPRKSAPKHRAMLFLPGQKQALVDELVGLIHDLMGHVPGQVDRGTHGFQKDGTYDDFPRFVHPLTTKCRISVPTVHIISRGDPIARQGELAVRLCDKKKARVIYMNGGHRMPVSVPDLRAVSSAMEWAMQKSQQL